MATKEKNKTKLSDDSNYIAKIPYFPIEGKSVEVPPRKVYNVEKAKEWPWGDPVKAFHPIFGEVKITREDAAILRIGNEAYSMLEHYRVPEDGTRLKINKGLGIIHTTFEGQYNDNLIALKLTEDITRREPTNKFDTRHYDVELEMGGGDDGGYQHGGGWKGKMIKIKNKKDFHWNEIVIDTPLIAPEQFMSELFSEKFLKDLLEKLKEEGYLDDYYRLKH